MTMPFMPASAWPGIEHRKARPSAGIVTLPVAVLPGSAVSLVPSANVMSWSIAAVFVERDLVGARRRARVTSAGVKPRSNASISMVPRVRRGRGRGRGDRAAVAPGDLGDGAAATRRRSGRRVAPAGAGPRRAGAGGERGDGPAMIRRPTRSWPVAPVLPGGWTACPVVSARNDRLIQYVFGRGRRSRDERAGWPAMASAGSGGPGEVRRGSRRRAAARSASWPAKNTACTSQNPSIPHGPPRSTQSGAGCRPRPPRSPRAG